MLNHPLGKLISRKICTKCGREYDNATEFFRRRKQNYKGNITYLLSTQCWQCNSEETLRFQELPVGRLHHAISHNIRHSLKGAKNGHTWQSLVGYTLLDLKTHLEMQFQPGMTWGNYGVNGWVIDHIRPVSSFQFNKPSDPDFKKCWALNNLQPLWSRENSRKHTKIGKLINGKLC